MFCVVCKKVVTELCDRCRQYHCDDHDCPIGSSRDDMAIVPLLAQVDDNSSDGAGESVNTEEVHHEDPVVEAQAEENRSDYRTGAIAAALLATWIAYSTWSERRSEGLGFQRMQALKAIDRFSGLLVPGQITSVPQSLYAFSWRRYLFTQGFKFGIVPTPMPFPRVFASMADIKLTIRLGLFSLFANENEFARFIQMVNQANPMRAVPQLIESDIVLFRRRMLGWSGAGFGLGSGTYSTTYSLIASRMRFPLITGIMNSTVLSLQIPWDIAMTFNYFAVNVGQNARILKTMSPESYARTMSVMKGSLKTIYPRLLASSLAATSVTAFFGVPMLMMKYFSKDK